MQALSAWEADKGRIQNEGAFINKAFGISSYGLMWTNED